MANDPPLSVLVTTACGGWQPPCSPASPGMVLPKGCVMTNSGGMNLVEDLQVRGFTSFVQWVIRQTTAKERPGCWWKWQAVQLPALSSTRVCPLVPSGLATTLWQWLFRHCLPPTNKQILSQFSIKLCTSQDVCLPSPWIGNIHPPHHIFPQVACFSASATAISWAATGSHCWLTRGLPLRAPRALWETAYYNQEPNYTTSVALEDTTAPAPLKFSHCN